MKYKFVMIQIYDKTPDPPTFLMAITGLKCDLDYFLELVSQTKELRFHRPMMKMIPKIAALR